MTRRIDRILFLTVIAIALLGLVALYSASAVLSEVEMKDPFYYINRQLVWTVIGLILFLVAIFLPTKVIEWLPLPSMAFSIILLLLVFVPGLSRSVSSSRGNFHRWVELGPIAFQPSEFAKVGLLLYSAWLLSKFKGERNIRRIVFLASPILLVLLLIIVEPQYGTTMTLIIVISAMLFVAGFPLLRLAGVISSAIPLLFLLAYLWEYRLERLKVWLDPYAYRYEAGYQLVMSFRAFKDGWWTGTDLASGVAHRYLTYGHTDFVFALFYEDFGFIGLLVLVVLYGFYCIRSARLIGKQHTGFLTLTAIGCVILFGLQSLINMFVVTGVVPTTGIGLPFMSYGGSSLIVQYILAGFVLNITSQVHRQAA